MGLGPFDLHGTEFLTLYAELALIAGIASLLIPLHLRPEGRAGHPVDEDDMALLAGGRARFAEAVAVRLIAVGAATVQARGTLHIRDQRGGQTLAERRIIALPSPVTWAAINLALVRPAEAGERRLVHAGLLLDGLAAQQQRLIQTAPLLLLFAFGLAKWVVGAMRDRPVGYLTVLLVLTAIAAVLRYAVLDRRTRAGTAALANARRRATRLRRAMPIDEAPLAVALFGTSVLAGSYLADFHKMRRTASSDSGGGGGCGSSGGGCGGGGCGGCS